MSIKNRASAYQQVPPELAGFIPTGMGKSYSGNAGQECSSWPGLSLPMDSNWNFMKLLAALFLKTHFKRRIDLWKFIIKKYKEPSICSYPIGINKLISSFQLKKKSLEIVGFSVRVIVRLLMTVRSLQFLNDTWSHQWQAQGTESCTLWTLPKSPDIASTGLCLAPFSRRLPHPHTTPVTFSNFLDFSNSRNTQRSLDSQEWDHPANFINPSPSSSGKIIKKKIFLTLLVGFVCSHY